MNQDKVCNWFSSICVVNAKQMKDANKIPNFKSYSEVIGEETC